MLSVVPYVNVASKPQQTKHAHHPVHIAKQKMRSRWNEHWRRRRRLSSLLPMCLSRRVFDAEPCGESTDNICIKPHMLYSRSLRGLNSLKAPSVSCNISCVLLLCGEWKLVQMVIWLFVAARELSWRQIKGMVGVKVYLASAQRTVCMCVCVYQVLSPAHWGTTGCTDLRQCLRKGLEKALMSSPGSRKENEVC